MASLMCPSATVRAGGGGACELATPVGEGGGLPPKAVVAVDDTVNDELMVKVHLLFHRAFRLEMDGIVQDALTLERMHDADGVREPSAASGAESAIPFQNPSTEREGREGGEALAAALENLRNRYSFLYKCYKFHSRAEDQVVFPAIERRVRNVVRAYSLEHEQEEDLFARVKTLLDTLVAERGPAHAATLRNLCGTLEAAHINLNQHLQKEEEQLLPLLRANFTVLEQTKMFWQLLCSIPVAQVGRVMQWALGSLAPDELQTIVRLLRTVVPNHELMSLVHVWLSVPTDTTDTEASASATPSSPASAADDATQQCLARAGEASTSSETAAAAYPPIRDMILVHDTIRAELRLFAAAVAQLVASGRSATVVRALHEHEAFLSAVCGSHTVSEEEVLFPAVVQLSGHRLDANLSNQHTDEAKQLAHLRSLVRHLQQLEADGADAAGDGGKGGKEVSAAQAEAEASRTRLLQSEAQAAVADIAAHLTAEEAAVLPVLERHCSTGQQRALVCGVLEAMPLRVLEHLIGRLGALVDRPQAEALLQNLHLAAAAGEGLSAILPRVFEQWIHRCSSPTAADEADTTAATADDDLTSGATLGKRRRPTETDASELGESGDGGGTTGPRQWSESSPPTAAKAAKVAAETSRQQSASDSDTMDLGTHERAGERVGDGMDGPRDPLTVAQPIDHIFQFHRALRRELDKLEKQSQQLLDLHTGKRDATELAAALDALHTRFQFLWGIYRTHSTAEDEIVFPALEAKDALHNISHSYTLDHHQEEALFRDIDGVLAALRDSSAANRESESPQPERHAERGRQLAHLTGMCTAMRVCLMKHLAIEDTELWPLFNVYFTVAEQQSVIGAIVGRSSAEVLQVMLPLIQAETTRKEEEEMLSSISLVTKNTNFDSWLKTWFVNPAEASASTDGAASADVVAASAAKSKMGAVQMQQQRAEEMEGRLADMARYLEPAPEVASAPSQVDASRGDELVVSWHNVFHLNQTQLQSAVLRVSRDEGLEPKRKAYLMQNLFTVRWLIAQQQGGAADKPSAVLSPSVDSSSASAPALTAAESSTTLPPPLPPPPPPPPDDGSPSALPRPVMHETHSVTSWHRQADSVLGCSHYARKAQLVAGCCQKVVPCRLCHDEQDTTHMLDRAATTHMVCMACGTEQEVAGTCRHCQVGLAHYFCATCKLFDDDPTHDIYHCPFCNLCRRGKGLGVDMFHCMRCNQCMALSLAQSHVCRERGLESDCPICHEDLFTSAAPVRQTQCGHFMHSACYKLYTASKYTCPMCSKSLADMTIYFNMLEAILAAEELPDEYKSQTQEVLCNDCGERGTTRFHFVYHKCPGCSSFNTRVV